MEVLLNNKYRIITDSFNYILQEKKFPDPNHRMTVDPTKFKWVDVGYYGNLKFLVNTLLEREIKQSEAISLSEVINVLNDSKNSIKNDIKLIAKKESARKEKGRRKEA